MAWFPEFFFVFIEGQPNYVTALEVTLRIFFKMRLACLLLLGKYLCGEDFLDFLNFLELRVVDGWERRQETQSRSETEF